jgi:hypothetical protein
MKDFKKILSVFALTTFVIIALGFIATTKGEAQTLQLPFCNTVIGPAGQLCDVYCNVMECTGGATDSPRCQAIADAFNRIVDADQAPCPNAIIVPQCGFTAAPDCGQVACATLSNPDAKCVKNLCGGSDLCI